MKIKSLVAAVGAMALLWGSAAPAVADHTNSKEPQAETQGTPAEGIALGEGTWDFIRNFPANPGSDLEFFKRGRRIYSSSGTLGQGDEQHVGQRLLRLTNRKGKVNPAWLVDHGSSACTTNPSGTTGLQHDVQFTPRKKPQLLIDTTDARQRCHDPDGGGFEIVDVTKVGKRTHDLKKRPRIKEIHLTRHDGTSHNVTADPKRSWILYSSNSDIGRPWIDVVDIRSCLGLQKQRLEKKRAKCRPKVSRIPFKDTWTAQSNEDPTDGEIGERQNPTGCHDITAEGSRLYCAALNGTAVFNVKDLTNKKGAVKGERLPCKVVKGTLTKAKVTNCDLGEGNDTVAGDVEAYEKLGKPRARGWKFVGSVNHPGIESGNTNQFVPADEGVAVSHEADPVFGGDFMMVTDERGGGVIPPGASCTTGLDNPIGNGGLHVFNIKKPGNFAKTGDYNYAKKPDGSKAIFISENVTPVPTFCNIHVIEKIPGEQRLVMSWYSQGIKIVDYFVDNNGRWTFDEVASYNLPGANTWAAEDFKIVNHSDGTRTYFFLASDIDRGIDVVKWRGPTNRKGERAPQRTSDSGNTQIVLLGLTLLPAAALFGRLRRRRPTEN